MPPRSAALLAGLSLALAACTSGPTTTDPSGQTPATPATASPSADEESHGDFAGAVELDEPALALTTVDAAGTVRQLDLLEETAVDVADLGSPGPDAAVHTDGRYLLVTTADGVEVVDSGVWTWDHVDHYHYYRAEPRALGLVPGAGPVHAATTNSSTSGGTGLFFTRTGEAVLLDTEALADGELVERFRVGTEPHDGMLVPVGDHALATEPGPDGTPARVVTLDAAGDPVPGGEHACPDAAGTLTTRVGTVIGCADGALLASPDDGADDSADGGLAVQRIPYPRGTEAPPATVFAGRDGRPTVAALAGPRRVWLLDTRELSWRLIESPVPLVQVTAVDDDDEHVLGLTRDGRVAVLDGAEGSTDRLLATTEPLAARSLRTGTGVPTLVVDQQRAYLSAPAERRMYEIDFADDARVARTFDTPTPPLHLAGTGR